MTTFVGFDIESTGVDSFTDRIVTFAIVAEDESVRKEWVIDPGVPIPEGASDIHGWTTERVQAFAGTVSPSEGLTEILDTLRALSAREDVIFTAYNCPFDTTMLNSELKRHGVIPEDSNDFVDMIMGNGILDPLVIDKATDRYRRGSRKLVDVSEHYGYTLVGAHEATADVLATIYLARTFWDRFKSKATIGQLMELQAASKEEQALSLQEYLIKKGEKDAEVRGDWPIILSTTP